jgi:hypothetical protein
MIVRKMSWWTLGFALVLVAGTVLFIATMACVASRLDRLPTDSGYCTNSLEEPVFFLGLSSLAVGAGGLIYRAIRSIKAGRR